MIANGNVGNLEDLYEPPLEFVVLSEGVALERAGNRLVGLCPLHSDSDPSFALWHYGGRDWVGCFVCGFGPTDAIGFLRETRGISYTEATVLLRRISRALPPDWESTSLPQQRTRGLRDFTRDAARARALLGSEGAPHRFLQRRGLGAHADWLIEEFRIGGDEKWIVVPHYTPSGVVAPGLKYRTEVGELLTLEESTLAFLYGCWRDLRQKFVVLVEGESDTWRVAAFFRSDRRVLVLGLPHGACGPKPSWLAALEGRKLALLFDGDDAGRRAGARWLEARPDAKLWYPGDELDASDLTDSSLQALTSTGLLV